MENDIITKSNDLIQASFKFTLNEYRILMYAVSCINPMSDEFPRRLNVDVKKMATMFGIEIDGLYSEIKDSIIRKFFKRELTLNLDGEKKKLCHWLDSLIYHDGSSRLELKFSEDSIPMLSKMKGQFTNYHIEQIADMKSIYAIRIYEFCILEINRRRLNQCDFFIETSVLREWLELEDKYKDYYDLKRRVINKAKIEINKYSDLTIDFEEIKKGRSVESIKFIIQRKDGAKPAKYVKEEQQALDFNSTNNNDEDTDFNTDNSPMTDEEFNHWMRKNSIKIRMSSYRVAEKVTCQLLRDYDFERIESALNYMDNAINKGKDIKNKPAYLVNAIKEGY